MRKTSNLKKIFFLCSITDIQATGIASVASNFHITDNQFKTIKTKAFVLSKFNRVYFNHNIMLNVEDSFIEFDTITEDEVQEVTFIGNEIHNASSKALNFISHLPPQTNIKFDDNSFNQECFCDIGKWLQDLFDRKEMNVDLALNTSFCKISKSLSHCFKLNEGLINMQNFTKLVCGNETDQIYCEPYQGETKTLDTTAIMIFDEMEENINSNMYLGIALGVILIIAVCGTVVILLIRGGIWLKRNGYCMRFRNIRLTQGEPSHDDERVMVDLERNAPKTDDNELTSELLVRLREALNDPDDEIKEQARERIEKLYERYITSDSYTNNNRQDEETHLYEELGNLQNGYHPPELPESPSERIKYMETRFCQGKGLNQRPTLVGEYSEPTDAAVHLYSELRDSRNDDENEKKSSVKSNESGKMALRPLPEKPKDRNVAGPSNKY